MFTYKEVILSQNDHMSDGYSDYSDLDFEPLEEPVQNKKKKNQHQHDGDEKSSRERPRTSAKKNGQVRNNKSRPQTALNTNDTTDYVSGIGSDNIGKTAKGGNKKKERGKHARNTIPAEVPTGNIEDTPPDKPKKKNNKKKQKQTRSPLRDSASEGEKNLISECQNPSQKNGKKKRKKEKTPPPEVVSCESKTPIQGKKTKNKTTTSNELTTQPQEVNSIGKDEFKKGSQSKKKKKKKKNPDSDKQHQENTNPTNRFLKNASTHDEDSHSYSSPEDVVEKKEVNSIPSQSERSISSLSQSEELINRQSDDQSNTSQSVSLSEPSLSESDDCHKYNSEHQLDTSQLIKTNHDDGNDPNLQSKGIDSHDVSNQSQVVRDEMSNELITESDILNEENSPSNQVLQQHTKSNEEIKSSDISDEEVATQLINNILNEESEPQPTTNLIESHDDDQTHSRLNSSEEVKNDGCSVLTTEDIKMQPDESSQPPMEMTANNSGQSEAVRNPKPLDGTYSEFSEVNSDSNNDDVGHSSGLLRDLNPSFPTDSSEASELKKPETATDDEKVMISKKVKDLNATYSDFSDDGSQSEESLSMPTINQKEDVSENNQLGEVNERPDGGHQPEEVSERPDGGGGGGHQPSSPKTESISSATETDDLNWTSIDSSSIIENIESQERTSLETETQFQHQTLQQNFQIDINLQKELTAAVTHNLQHSQFVLRKFLEEEYELTSLHITEVISLREEEVINRLELQRESDNNVAAANRRIQSRIESNELIRQLIIREEVGMREVLTSSELNNWNNHRSEATTSIEDVKQRWLRKQTILFNSCRNELTATQMSLFTEIQTEESISWKTLSQSGTSEEKLSLMRERNRCRRDLLFASETQRRAKLAVEELVVWVVLSCDLKDVKKDIYKTIKQRDQHHHLQFETLSRKQMISTESNVRDCIIRNYVGSIQQQRETRWRQRSQQDVNCLTSRRVPWYTVGKKSGRDQWKSLCISSTDVPQHPSDLLPKSRMRRKIDYLKKDLVSKSHLLSSVGGSTLILNSFSQWDLLLREAASRQNKSQGLANYAVPQPAGSAERWSPVCSRRSRENLVVSEDFERQLIISNVGPDITT